MQFLFLPGEVCLFEEDDAKPHYSLSWSMALGATLACSPVEMNIWAIIKQNI